MFKVSLDKQESKKKEHFPVHVTNDSTYKCLSKILLIMMFLEILNITNTIMYQCFIIL